eukprot:CFRG4318T1
MADESIVDDLKHASLDVTEAPLPTPTSKRVHGRAVASLEVYEGKDSDKSNNETRNVVSSECTSPVRISCDDFDLPHTDYWNNSGSTENSSQMRTAQVTKKNHLSHHRVGGSLQSLCCKSDSPYSQNSINAMSHNMVPSLVANCSPSASFFCGWDSASKDSSMTTGVSRGSNSSKPGEKRVKIDQLCPSRSISQSNAETIADSDQICSPSTFLYNTGGNPNDENILNAGSNRLNHSDARRNRVYNASVMSKFSRQSFWIVLIFALLITLPFVITNIAMLSVDNMDINTCHPEFAMSVSLVVSMGVLHLCVVLVYIYQVYKHRHNTVIKSRGNYFVLQTCIISPFITIMSIFLSLCYLGVLNGECIYSYFQTWSNSASITLMTMYGMVRLGTTILLSGIVARQRLLYLLFIRNEGGIRIYSKKDLQVAYLCTNIAFIILFVLSEIPYLVTVIVSDVGNNGAPVGWTIAGQVFLVLAELVFFGYYGYKTRKIDVVFSDWWSNLRIIILYSTTNIAVGIVLAIDGASLAVGLLAGAVEMFVVTVYLMDSFTAAIVYINYGVERTVLPSSGLNMTNIPSRITSVIGSAGSRSIIGQSRSRTDANGSADSDTGEIDLGMKIRENSDKICDSKKLNSSSDASVDEKPAGLLRGKKRFVDPMPIVVEGQMAESENCDNTMYTDDEEVFAEVIEESITAGSSCENDQESLGNYHDICLPLSEQTRTDDMIAKV